jgi:XTP/dITP diphosphohydrolase
MKKIILATKNKNKLSEIRSILPQFEIVGLDEIFYTEEIEETGITFEENALLKAVKIHEDTGATVIADDSGLCVDALNGAPGVYSARYSGNHGDDSANNALLLQNLTGVSDRAAKFVCAAAVCFEDGSAAVAVGEVFGKIGFEYEGENGFGYDPLFISDELGISFGLLTEEVKNRYSHRRRAFDKLKVKLIEHEAASS